MSDDLVEWLRLQLDEDERVARAAEGHSVFDGTGIVITHNRTAVIPSHAATHIARWDPARVLREVEALRKILARHEPIEVFGQLLCTYCGVTKGASRPDASWPCPDLRDLAAIFDDRPRYRKEWRPA